MARLPKNRRPTHPGDMLRSEFLGPLGVSQRDFAERIRVSYVRLNELVNGRRGVTPDTALRLAKALGTSPEFWLNLQQSWDLWEALHGPDAADLDGIERLEGVA